jgi:hypothetical protein
VGLKLHSRSTINAASFWKQRFFRKTIRSYLKLICFEFLIVLDSICALPSSVWCLYVLWLSIHLPVLPSRIHCPLASRHAELPNR